MQPTADKREPVLIEVAVDSFDDAVAAYQGGADRLELCRRLDLDGLTPTPELLRAVMHAVPIPVVAMVRSRDGGFVYTERELGVMERQLDALAPCAPRGFVFGALQSDFSIDQGACQRLLRRCRGFETVFHRAFDHVPDKPAGLETLISFGFTRVLTSPGSPEWGMNRPSLEMLARLNAQSPGRIEILPGGGIRAMNAPIVVMETGCRQIHSSCRQPPGAGLPPRFDIGALQRLRQMVNMVCR